LAAARSFESAFDAARARKIFAAADAFDRRRARPATMLGAHRAARRWCDVKNNQKPFFIRLL